MEFTNEELYKGVLKRDTRCLSRLITLTENGEERAQQVLAKLYKKNSRSHVVGITGPPGAGKSTLVDCMARQWKQAGKSVAILAIDPTSPFTGGAILGDRIRMVKTSEDNDVYIRSMATRGALGGLSHSTLDAIHILEAAQFDLILVETVGVGQAEVDIVKSVDSCVVVLVPGLGDSVQAIKAGILEIADIFVVNKSDREGADRVHKDIRFLLTHNLESSSSWEVPINRTVGTKCEGVSELTDNISAHYKWLTESDELIKRRELIIETRLLTLAAEMVVRAISTEQEESLAKLVEKCSKREIDIYSAVSELLSDTALSTKNP